MKRILAFLIVFATALSLSVPALAAGSPVSVRSALISACNPNESTKESNTPQTQKQKHGNTYIFIDVPDNYWAYEDIKSFIDKGIISGYGDGTFAPDNGVTREQFCKMLALTFNAPLTTPATPSFSDVGPDNWSYLYVEACKDFLTAYASPFGGPPAFHPTEYATREDIAVALVRMMGLTADDVKNANYAKTKFRDSGSITPALLPYVSLACELGLIGGYPDKTFRPTKSITRAETVVLLGRATKQAVVDINGELDLSAKCVYSQDGKKVSVNIEADVGTAVTVNGSKITMKSNGAGKYEGVYTYEFTGEGSKTFTIIGVKGDKTKTIEVTAEYKIGAPVLNITQCPATTTTGKVTIKGTLTDTAGKKVTLKINDKTVSVDNSGNWSYTVKLQQGENKFTFVATNAAGVKVTQERTIVYTASGLQLTITECPAAVTTNTVTIRGTVTDPDHQVTLTINGKAVSIGSNGAWSKTFTLNAGENKFTFVATSTSGKTVTQEKTVVYTAAGPQLTITECPATVTTNTVTIRGTVTDPYYGVTLTINGKAVSIASNGAWSKTFTLNAGENKFTIVATNTAGKSVTQEKTIVYTASELKLTITECPATVTTNSVTIRGTVTDPYHDVTLTINGKAVSVDSNGAWSKTFTLNEGENKFVFVATSTSGKSVTQEKTVVCTLGSPTITVTKCPDITDQKLVTIEGTIGGERNDATLYINDQIVPVNADGSFAKAVTLNVGDNTVVLRAVNAYGKATSVVRTIKYLAEIAAPALTVNDIPATVDTATLTVTGSLSDTADPNAKVYVNDQLVASKTGNWSATITLSEGANTIVIVATNFFGKSTTIVKTVTYTPADTDPSSIS